MLNLIFVVAWASARSTTIETRVRETGREVVSASECTSYTVIGRAGYTTWGTAVIERVSLESYLVEVVQEGFWGDRTERLLPGSEKVAIKMESSRKEFFGARAQAACESYRASVTR